MAIEGSGGKVQRTKEEVLSAACVDLSEDDFSLLKEIYDHGEMVPFTDHSGSDYTKEKLRVLRNRGLISTETGRSFGNSEGVKVTELGRVVVEDVMDG